MRYVTLTAGLASAPLIAILVLVELRSHEVVETVYSPALWLARVVTPDEWQVPGSIPLGLAWLIGGTVLYALIVVIAIAVIGRVRRGGEGEQL